jgi:hypothetical protein
MRHLALRTPRLVGAVAAAALAAAALLGLAAAAPGHAAPQASVVWNAHPAPQGVTWG